MGASFALALKQFRLSSEVVGYGRTAENLKRAKEKKIIDSFETDPTEACRDADLIVLATPVGIFIETAKRIRPALKKNARVTDVGSVKGKLVREMELLMPEGVFFVGGHPVAGSDRSGIDTAGAGIFRKAKCIITPTENTDKEAIGKVVAIWEAFGSRIELMDPYEHDRIYAAVSHLPHLLAYEIVNTVADIDASYLSFCGSGFMDTTRIASSPPDVWRDICLLNRDNLIEYLELLKRNLDRVSQYLRAYDSGSLEKDFQKARTLREGIGQN